MVVVILGILEILEFGNNDTGKIRILWLMIPATRLNFTVIFSRIQRITIVFHFYIFNLVKYFNLLRDLKCELNHSVIELNWSNESTDSIHLISLKESNLQKKLNFNHLKSFRFIDEIGFSVGIRNLAV